MASQLRVCLLLFLRIQVWYLAPSPFLHNCLLTPASENPRPSPYFCKHLQPHGTHANKKISALRPFSFCALNKVALNVGALCGMHQEHRFVNHNSSGFVLRQGLLGYSENWTPPVSVSLVLYTPHDGSVLNQTPNQTPKQIDNLRANL